MPGTISTSKNELNFQLAENEETAVFARANADYSQGKIYLSPTDYEGEVTFETITFSDSRYKDSDPWLSPQGDVLYFISDRPAFVGDVKEDHNDYDIWRSRKSGDQWLSPEHLSAVNSKFGEFGPEVNNGYLYFSSKKSGVYNIYKSKVLPNGFSNPEKLPPPINTEFHDSDFTLSKDGNIALWWSTRPGGFGSGDLYLSRRVNGNWSHPQNLGAKLNSKHLDYTPNLSPNHAMFYFATNKPFPGQEQGAADIYKIPVKEVPVLKAAIVDNTLAKLKAAFGGEDILSSIERLSYRLKTEKSDSDDLEKDVYIDFTSEIISEYFPQSSERRVASSVQGSVTKDGSRQLLSHEENARLHRSITYNFLYYLTAEDLELEGPINVTGHGSLNWFSMHARGARSPLVGIDPITGRISKVLAGNQQVVVIELDYQRHESGLIWPFRYVVTKDNLITASGYFSELIVNPAVNDEIDSLL